MEKLLKRARAVPLRTQMVIGGALLGALAFLVLYGFSPLDVTNDAWLRGGYVERDTVQHYTGWLFYRASGWGWPLGMAENMNWPYGSYVGLADSIPVFALLFKLLSPILPATFQYFGLWGFLCCILQGAAAALLLSLFTESRVRCLLGASLFVLAPILLDRLLRHGALGAQWLVLFAICLYFTHRRSGRFFSPGYIVLCGLSIAIHPYFVPMVYAMMFAMLVENAVAHRKWWQPLAQLFMCFAATIAVGWVFGAFSTGTGGGGTTYGYFSMNLNALYNPTSIGVEDWSLFLPAQNQTLGNYDGFNYLGLGVLLTLAIIAADLLRCLIMAIIGRRGRGKAAGRDVRRHAAAPLWAFLRRHLGMVLVCAFLTVFAVSNVVTANGREWFTIPLPQFISQLAGTFRSSGRMFYPVWYLLLTACLYWMNGPGVRKHERWLVSEASKHREPDASRAAPRRARDGRVAAAAGTIALCALVAVQLVDLSPALADKFWSLRRYEPVYHNTLVSGFWDEIAGEYAHLSTLDGAALTHAIDVAEYTADAGMTTNDPFTARFDVDEHSEQIIAARAELESGAPRADTLYMTSIEKNFLDYAQYVSEVAFCAQVDEHWYVIAPYTESFTGYAGGDAVLRYEDYPLMIAEYSDILWDDGVLIPDPRVVCFIDSDFVRARVDGMSALRANGVDYPILQVDYGDEGWVLVTLEIEDAAALRGQPLESIP